jgi:AraC-like DNA-binding protein
VDIGGILQSSIIKKLGFTTMNCIYKPKNKKKETIKNKFYKIYESALEAGTHSFRTSANLYDLLAELEEVRFGAKPVNLQERYVKEALTYIENNLETADVKSTAADCSISSTYLTRVCKSVLGISLKDLITITRLQVACNYLKYTRKPIKEVGELVGFPQRKYFTKVFKSVFDITPTKYREEN